MYTTVKTRVLLISPSSNRFYIPTAPLGLALIAGTLPSEVEVKGLDLNVYKWAHGLNNAETLRLVEEWLKNRSQEGAKPDVVGITVYQETLEEALAYAGLARKYGAVTVAGGIYPTLFPDDIPPAFDYLVRGEGVEPFPLLVDAIFWDKRGKGRPADFQIPGVSVWNSEADCWIHHGPAVYSTGSCAVLPDRGIFDDLNRGFRYFSARIQSSRGCPYGCSFCVNSELTRKEWLPRPADEVMDEVLSVLTSFDISELSFSDDQFLGVQAAHYHRAHSILKQIKEITCLRNLRINLQVRADHWLRALECEPGLCETIQAINSNFVDPNPAVSARLHGRPVRGISLDIGVESNLPERLKAFDKGLSVETNLAAIRKARELGVDLGAYMILFSPEITLEQLQEEFAIYEREVLRTDIFSKAALFGLFQELVPYRGTKAYTKLKAEGDLVEKEGFSGFRFRDSQVAVFYLLYLNELYRGNLEVMESDDLLLERIRELLRISSVLGKLQTVKPLLNEVVCEMKDQELIKKLCRKLVEVYNRIA